MGPVFWGRNQLKSWSGSHLIIKWGPDLTGLVRMSVSSSNYTRALRKGGRTKPRRDLDVERKVAGSILAGDIAFLLPR